MVHGAQNLAAAFHNDLRSVALERTSESIIGCEEEPSVTATFYNFTGRTGCKSISIKDPLDAVGRTVFSREVNRAGRMGNEEATLFACDFLDCETNRRHRDIYNQINVFDVVPTARDSGSDIGLELMIGRNNLDRFTGNRGAKIFN